MAGRWIGRGGPIALSPRSPDLTPLDFFLWDYVKNIVYQVKINDLQHLKARIRDDVVAVTTWNEVKYRLDICHATKVAHIEILIVSLCNGVIHKCIYYMLSEI
jgi:hypothetical protein